MKSIFNAWFGFVVVSMIVGLIGWVLFLTAPGPKAKHACHDFANGGRICIEPTPLPFEALLAPPEKKGAIIYCVSNTAGLLECSQ